MANSKIRGKPLEDLLAIISTFLVEKNVFMNQPAHFPLGADIFTLDGMLDAELPLGERFAY
jgi:hypothetical protein